MVITCELRQTPGWFNRDTISGAYKCLDRPAEIRPQSLIGNTRRIRGWSISGPVVGGGLVCWVIVWFDSCFCYLYIGLVCFSYFSVSLFSIVSSIICFLQGYFAGRVRWWLSFDGQFKQSFNWVDNYLKVWPDSAHSEHFVVFSGQSLVAEFSYL